MADPTSTPTFSTLLQRFFVEHLGHQRAVSPRTIAAYRDTFRLLLSFAEGRIGKAPTALALVDLDARLILSFLDHLEQDRKNGARSRNARLAAHPIIPEICCPPRPDRAPCDRAGAGHPDEAV
jgi:hypothetical protein